MKPVFWIILVIVILWIVGDAMTVMTEHGESFVNSQTQTQSQSGNN